MIHTMCRLFGMSGQPPLPLGTALEAFYPLCRTGCVKATMTPGHSDGWGVSGYHQGRVVYFARRSSSAVEDESLYKEVVRKVTASTTPVLMAHLRKASEGIISVANTHPFHSRDWAFAHNGTIFNTEALPLVDAQPQGSTDSERFGYWLLDRVSNAVDIAESIAESLKQARALLRFSALNFLLTNGRALYAYREVSTNDLEKNETLDDRRKYYTLSIGDGKNFTVVCSEPLSLPEVQWRPLPQRTLAVIPSETGLAEFLTID